MINQNLRPLSNKILVYPEPKKEKTETGLFIPETAAKDEPRMGTVRATGRGNVIVSESGDNFVIVPLEVKAGDKVLFAPMDFAEIEQDGEKLLLMTEEQILAVL
jgi:chaperonin GroES